MNMIIMILAALLFSYGYIQLSNHKTVFNIVPYIIITQLIAVAAYFVLPLNHFQFVFIVIESSSGLLILFTVLMKFLKNANKGLFLFLAYLMTNILANLKMEMTFNTIKEAEISMNVLVILSILCMTNFSYCYSLLIRNELSGSTEIKTITLKLHLNIWTRYLLLIGSFLFIFNYFDVMSINRILANSQNMSLLIASFLNSIFLIGFIEELCSRVFIYQIGLLYYQKFSSIFERPHYEKLLKVFCVFIFILFHSLGHIVFLPWIIFAILLSYLFFDVLEKTNSVAYIAILHGLYDILYYLAEVKS